MMHETRGAALWLLVLVLALSLLFYLMIWSVRRAEPESPGLWLFCESLFTGIIVLVLIVLLLLALSGNAAVWQLALVWTVSLLFGAVGLAEGF